MRKSQVTVFIILGIIVLIIFGFVMAMHQQLSNWLIKKGNQKVDVADELRKKYTAYVESCVEQATKEALITVGMQGGVIYDYQATGGKHYLGPTNGYPYGKFVFPFRVGMTIYNVSYGITKPQLGSIYHPDVPFYPYGMTNLISNPKTLSPLYSNTLGNYPRSPFTPLCDSFGENKKDVRFSLACETYDTGSRKDTNSVQEYLEAYIENRSKQCVRFDRIPELKDFKITIENVTANVTIGEEHVQAKVSMPIKIDLDTFDSQIQLEQFEVKYKVRLKKIHELISHLINHDVNNIYFNIVRDAPTLNDCRELTGGNAICKKPGMDVHKISNPCMSEPGLCSEGEHDDILIVTDRESLIDGIPYVFQVAIENRYPALDLIQKEIGLGSQKYDYVTFVGEDIIINPIGIDPDEDQHNHLGFMDYLYHYEFWKETYDDLFDCPGGGCNAYDESRIVHILGSHPKNWTSSDLYNETRREASYTTGPQDLGIHTVKVEVCDDEGLCDSQAVIVYVVNGSFAAGYNMLGLPGYASLEDPYILSSPIQGVAANPLYNWTISDKSGNVAWKGSTLIENKSIPEGDFDIDTINVAPFFNAPENYTLQVDIFDKIGSDWVLALDGSSDLNIIQVKECLPYRSPYPPYPYNTTNPFLGNHSCCQGDPAFPDQPGWGEIMDTSQKCYSVVEYGCIEDPNFQEISGSGAGSCIDADVTCNNPANPVFNDGLQNDVYRREFQRYCDGDRGNECEGEIKDVRTNVMECDVCQKCTYGSSTCVNIAMGYICSEDEKCTQGPGKKYPAPLGPWKCKGTCQNGVCNISTSCACDAGCGAECTTPDIYSYKWQDKQCKFDCNNYLTIELPTCQFYGNSGVQGTVCSSPNPVDPGCQSFEKSGLNFEICPENQAYTAPIDSVGAYASYCRSADQCFVSSCLGNGTINLAGDECLDAGMISADKCYYNPTGATNCNMSAGCEYSDVWGIHCDQGSAETHDCQDYAQGFCYPAVCSATSGWDRAPDLDVLLGAGNFQCSAVNCRSGYHMSGSTCYYDIECTSTGWQAQHTDTCSASVSGNLCYYGATCGNNGCNYQVDAIQPVCANGVICDNANGWVCI